jgi:hypothetical protein
MMNDTNTPAKHGLSARLGDAAILSSRIKCLSEAANLITSGCHPANKLDAENIVFYLTESAAFFADMLTDQLDAMGRQARQG